VSHLKGKTSFVTVSRVPGGQKGVVQRSHEDEFQCKMAKVVALAAIAAKVPNDRGVSAVSRNQRRGRLASFSGAIRKPIDWVPVLLAASRSR